MAHILKFKIRLGIKSVHALIFPDLLKEIDNLFESIALKFPSMLEPGAYLVEDIELAPENESVANLPTIAIKTFKSLSGARRFIFKSDMDEVLRGEKERLTIFKKVGGYRNEAKRVVNSTLLERKIDDNEEVIETTD